MLSLDQVRHVHAEITTRCNARCPMCPRNYRGYDYNSGYPITELRLEDFKKIMYPQFLEQLRRPSYMTKPPGYDHHGVSFNGNLGDFAAARDGVEIVQYLVDNGVDVAINTNGSQRSPSWWAALARPGVTVGFALDGLADTHHLYRQDTDWHKIIANARAFIEAGGRAIWRFVPFEHNSHQVQACRDLAKELGFAEFENIYDGRDQGPVYHRDGTFSHWVGQPWQTPDNKPKIDDLLADHKTWFRIEQTWPHDGADTVIACHHKRAKTIYLAADGSIYPCCYLGFYPSSMHHAGNEQTKLLVKENNALEYGLEHCFNWFDQVEKTWSQPSVREGRLYQCASTCGKKP